jgi:hypothetical protein
MAEEAGAPDAVPPADEPPPSEAATAKRTYFGTTNAAEAGCAKNGTNAVPVPPEGTTGSEIPLLAPGAPPAGEAVEESPPEVAALPAKRLTPHNLAARRRNAPRGGVKTPEGKAVSRHNARRHGIFATALTDADAEDLAGVHEAFYDDLQPATAVEEALVEKLAVCYLRLERCARAEAVHYRATWFPRRRDEGFFGPGDMVGGMRPWFYETIATVLGRYDTTLTNQFLRLMHELERVQRARKGEAVAPPAAADLTVSEA